MRMDHSVSELENPEMEKKVAELEISVSALEMTELRLLSALENGGHPGAESSILKIKGTEIPEKYIVISAHHDHLGMRGNKIYNGADDDA